MTSAALCRFCPALLLALGCAVAAEAQQPFQQRGGDQIWLVNTRGVGSADRLGWSTVRYDAGYWVGSDDNAFAASDDEATTTVIYIHGNRMDAAGAEARGLAIYRELFSSHDGGKVRFVIWSWPADQIRGPFRDVRAKAARTDEEAYLLARFLAPIPAKRRVGLIGFSYGARIISGGLHALAGGEVNGRMVQSGERASFRVVFWAAGVQNDWLLPGNVQSKALPLGQAWLNVYNSCDRVLARFDRVDRCDCSPGLGHTGLTGKNRLTAELALRYEDWDAAQLIGDDHRSEPYFFQSEIIRRSRETVLAK